MAKKSWKDDPTIPRFLVAAIRKGLQIADAIGVEEGNDKTWLTITFKKKSLAAIAKAEGRDVARLKRAKEQA